MTRPLRVAWLLTGAAALFTCAQILAGAPGPTITITGNTGWVILTFLSIAYLAGNLAWTPPRRKDRNR